ncbi:hypothetical protein Ahy_A03g010217 isoform C [Arachis hypogaea]|nr:hypothetical protein Ahy_A03g010217 isoform C [Arachis hypogaea]
MHGEDYICLGFLFGDKSKVAYLSDVSRIPATTDYVISKSGAGQLDLLILDSLYKTGSNKFHLCLPQTLETVKMLCPKQALLIGMNHEFDHHQDNELLMEWSRRVMHMGMCLVHRLLPEESKILSVKTALLIRIKWDPTKGFEDRSSSN